jgi:hypothetical protein
VPVPVSLPVSVSVISVDGFRDVFYFIMLLLFSIMIPLNSFVVFDYLYIHSALLASSLQKSAAIDGTSLNFFWCCCSPLYYLLFFKHVFYYFCKMRCFDLQWRQRELFSLG